MKKSLPHWSETDRAVARELMRLRNVGPATADDLLRLGIRSVEALADQDAGHLYQRLTELDGTPPDPCVEDVFSAIIDIAKGAPPRDWWSYSRERKDRSRVASRKSGSR